MSLVAYVLSRSLIPLEALFCMYVSASLRPVSILSIFVYNVIKHYNSNTYLSNKNVKSTLQNAQYQKTIVQSCLSFVSNLFRWHLTGDSLLREIFSVLFGFPGISNCHVVSVESSSLIHYVTFRVLFILP